MIIYALVVAIITAALIVLPGSQLLPTILAQEDSMTETPTGNTTENTTGNPTESSEKRNSNRVEQYLEKVNKPVWYC